METTLIYFSVKAMSATYILYKVWMFIFSPKVYKFWDNQLRYMRMARIRLWKSRKKRMVEKARKARYRARLDKAEAWIAQAENDILKVWHEKKTETQPNPLDEYNEVIGKTKIVYLEDPEVARKTPTRSEPMKKEPIEEDKDINTDDVIDDFTPKKGLTESEKRELMSNDGCRNPVPTSGYRPVQFFFNRTEYSKPIGKTAQRKYAKWKRDIKTVFGTDWN